MLVVAALGGNALLRRGEPLTAEALAEQQQGRKPLEVWFCGPSGFADALREGLQDVTGRIRFHQEAFEMR